MTNNLFNKTEFLKGFRDGIKPVERISLSDFAEKYIYLPSTNAISGLISMDITPYFRDPLNDLSVYSDVNKVVFVGCVQIGKTNMGLMFLTSTMKLSPGPTAVFMPRDVDANNFSTQKFNPIVSESPALRDIIDVDIRNSLNRVDRKIFKGGFINFLSGSTSNSYRMLSIKNLYIDEYDQFPDDIDEQGDPLILAENRTTSFSNSYKELVTSTINGSEEQSKIYREYKKGSMAKYYIPCPKCNFFQTLKFNQLIYNVDENNDLIKDSVKYQCEECFHLIDYKELYSLNLKGEWREDKPNASFKSYIINALYSPFITWEKVIREYIRSEENNTSKKAFVNTYLAEPFEESQHNLNAEELYNRTSSGLNECEVDKSVIFITAGVDTQNDRFALDIKGWGKGGECWTLLYKEIYAKSGNLDEEEIWDELESELNRTFNHPLKSNMKINTVCIDYGGHYTKKVYDFCLRDSRFIPVAGAKHKTYKGYLVSNPRKIRTKLSNGNFSELGIYSRLIGTEIIKEEIYSNLSKNEVGNNYYHFHNGLNKRYFEMLTSEKKVYKYKNGTTQIEWVLPSGRRNESLDTFVYNYAAFFGIILMNNTFTDFDYERFYSKIFNIKKEEVNSDAVNINSKYSDSDIQSITDSSNANERRVTNKRRVIRRKSMNNHPNRI